MEGRKLKGARAASELQWRSIILFIIGAYLIYRQLSTYPNAAFLGLTMLIPGSLTGIAVAYTSARRELRIIELKGETKTAFSRDILFIILGLVLVGFLVYSFFINLSPELIGPITCFYCSSVISGLETERFAIKKWQKKHNKEILWDNLGFFSSRVYASPAATSIES